MSDYWVDVQGYKVPLYHSEIGTFGYKRKPSSSVMTNTIIKGRRRYIKYTDRHTAANIDRLVSASLNEFDEIEAGYLTSESAVIYYLSTGQTPRVDAEV